MIDIPIPITAIKLKQQQTSRSCEQTCTTLRVASPSIISSKSTFVSYTGGNTENAQLSYMDHATIPPCYDPSLNDTEDDLKVYLSGIFGSTLRSNDEEEESIRLLNDEKIMEDFKDPLSI
jgi:hypothetical protein